MQTQWLTKVKVENFLFPIVVDQSNKDVRFWHKLQRAKPALLSDRLMLIIPRGECALQQKRTLTCSRQCTAKSAPCK